MLILGIGRPSRIFGDGVDVELGVVRLDILFVVDLDHHVGEVEHVDLDKMPPQVRKIGEILQASQMRFIWGANEQLPDDDYNLAIGIGPSK
jgi:hypothetical protein